MIISSIFIVMGIIMEGIIIVGVFIYLKRREKIKDIPLKDNDDLHELIHLMKQEKEEKKMMDRDKELAEYANKKLRGMPAGNVQSNLSVGEQPLHANTRGELIPFGMSEQDKAILKEFYR